MGYSKLTKPAGAIPNKTSRVSFGTRGRNEIDPSKMKAPEKQFIEGYDYKPVNEDKGSLRKNKIREQAKEIAYNKELTQEQKEFRLQQLANSERIHNNQFKPDQEKRRSFRERLLNKEDSNSLTKNVNGVSFSRRTDGEYYSDN